jgi:hypothetical protein
MAITKIQSESLNLADNYDFTGTVTGAGGSNTPAFHATTSNTSAPSATFTTAIYSVSDRDTNSLYDTSTGIFTVTSSTTGYYFFYASVGSAIITSNRLQVNLVKNGSTYLLTSEAQSDTSGYPAWNVSGVIPLLSSGDNVRVRWYQNSGSSKNLTNEENKNFFGAYKIIE